MSIFYRKQVHFKLPKYIIYINKKQKLKADHLSFFDASKNITYRYGDNDLVVNKALQDVCDVRQGLLKEIYESLGITQLSQDPVEFDLYNMEQNLQDYQPLIHQSHILLNNQSYLV